MTDRVVNPVLIQMRAINAQMRAKIVEGLAVVPMVTLRDILKLMDTFDKEDPHAEEKVAYDTLVALNQSLTTERNQLRKAVARLQLEISRVRAEKGEAADRIEQLTAERDEAINQLDSAIHSQIVLEKRTAAVMEDRKFILEERDRTFALVLARAEAAEADAARLRIVLTRV